MSRSSSTSRICGSSAMTALLGRARRRRQHKLCRQLSSIVSRHVRRHKGGDERSRQIAPRPRLSRGDLIGAYDATVAAIADGDDSGAIRHQQMLALARMGDTERAMELFAAYGLDRSDQCRRARDRRPPAQGPRAGAAAGRGAAGRRWSEAFEAYHAIYRESGDSFPGINAATLALLAGRDERGARARRGPARRSRRSPPAADYYKAATRAEALLILGRTGGGDRSARRRAGRAPAGDHGGRSTHACASSA